MRRIEYNKEPVPQNILEIESVGNVCIEAINEDGFYYYLLIKTSLGQTEIYEYGPCIPDLDKLPSGYSCSYEKEGYNEKKLILRLTKWLNDFKKGIKEANLIDEKLFLDSYKDIMYNIDVK